MNLLPDIPAKAFTLSACVVGFLLLDDLNDKEQNALGNWLMLVAQILCTNAFYRQLQDERKLNDMTNEDVMNMMSKMKDALEKEMGNLDTDYHK